MVKEYDPYAVSSIESSSSSTSSSSEADEYHPFTQTIYDEPTGAAIQSIRNPDSAAAPGDPQYNLTTDFRVDPLGRRVLTLGPPFLSPLPVAEVEGEAALASGALVEVRAASFTGYRDVEHAVWTASGYATGSMPGEYVFTLQNPVSITRMDHDGRTVDSIQAVRMPCAGVPALAGACGRRPALGQWSRKAPERLSAGDCFPQSSYVRWTHNIYNDTHDLVATRRYTNIPARRAGDAPPPSGG